jgi:formylglycine-generating enzyme required for sulfatase activity
MDSSLSDVDTATLREQLASTFNPGELKTLCFDLKIPYDDLSGDRLEDKTRELVLYCQRRGLIPQLVGRCQDLRPNIVWALVRANPEPKVTPPPLETDSTIPFEWVTIPAGEFLMGSDNKQDQDAEATELPQHPIHLREYRIARVPVTVAQFRRFVQAKGSKINNFPYDIMLGLDPVGVQSKNGHGSQYAQSQFDTLGFLSQAQER